MRPILFHVAGTDIWSHPVFAGIGVAVALFVTWHMAELAGRRDRSLLFIVAGGLLGAAILARFGLVFRYLLDADTPTVGGLLRYGGRTVLGGLAGGYIGIVLTKRLIGYRRSTGEIFAPGVALGMAIGRLGCFLTERPGTVTSLPWGVRIPSAAVPLIPQCPACVAHSPMHPSFLYEAAFDVLAALALFSATRAGRSRATWMTEGDYFKLFLLSYAVFRFFVEYVRDNPPMMIGLSGSQVFAMISTCLLATYFVRRRLRYSVTSLLAESV